MMKCAAIYCWHNTGEGSCTYDSYQICIDVNGRCDSYYCEDDEYNYEYEDD